MTPEASEEPRTLLHCRPLRHADYVVDVWIAGDNSRRVGKHEHVDFRIGHARRRLRINGVVNSRSPKRRREITRIRDGRAAMMIFRRTGVNGPSRPVGTV